MSVGEAVRSPQFIILLLTNFFCCATHSGPIIHTVSYAVSCGIPLIAAVSIYSLEGFAGLGGRIAFGILGDRLGAKRVLVAGLLIQAFGALAYVFVRDLAAFYAVAAVFGFVGGPQSDAATLRELGAKPFGHMSELRALHAGAQSSNLKVAFGLLFPLVTAHFRN